MRNAPASSLTNDYVLSTVVFFVFFIGQGYIAHRRCGIAGDEDGGVIDFAICPAFERKAGVVGKIFVPTNKIGKRTGSCRTERLRRTVKVGLKSTAPI